MAYSTGTNNAGVSATPSVAVPIGLQTGDIVILVLTADHPSIPLTWPSGFTQLVVGNNNDQCTAAAWKRQGSTPDSGTYTMGSIAASWDYVMQALVFTGRSFKNNPVASVANITNGNSPSPASVPADGVTAIDGDDLMWVGALDTSAAGIANIWTPPGGFTAQQTGESSPGWAAMCSATQDNVSAGATGTKTGSVTLTSGGVGTCGLLIRIPKYVSGWTLVGSAATGVAGGATTTLNRTISGVQAGDLVVCLIKWEDADVTVSVSDGASTFIDELAANHPHATNPYSTVVYCLSSVAVGTVTYTMTLSGAGQPFVDFIVGVFRPNDGDTTSIDGTSGYNSGIGVSLTSSSITTVGADGIAFGTYGDFTGTHPTSSTFAGNVETSDIVGGSAGGGVGASMLAYYMYTVGFTGVWAATNGNSDQWECQIIAFKRTIGSGGAPPPSVSIPPFRPNPMQYFLTR